VWKRTCSLCLAECTHVIAVALGSTACQADYAEGECGVRGPALYGPRLAPRLYHVHGLAAVAGVRCPGIAARIRVPTSAAALACVEDECEWSMSVSVSGV
jgi:hypothetical protein